MILPGSLQGRLLVLVLGLLGTVWLAAGLFIWRDMRSELGDLLDGHLAQAAALLVVQQGNEIGDGDLDLDAPNLHPFAPKVAFQVFQDGQMVMHSANAPEKPFFDTGGQPASGFRDVRVGPQTWRVFAARGAEHDLQVFVAERADSREAILWAALRGSLWPALLGLPLVALGIVWSVNHSVAPLRLLRRRLAERHPQAEEALVVPGAPSELAPAVAALNDLFVRTGRLLDAERRFTADAAHELRTPIAAIRAQAQVAQGEDSAPARQAALAATLQGCDRASHLVDQLLTLSRLEAEALPDARPIDLVPVVRQVLAELAPAAVAREQELELEAAGPMPVAGDAPLLAVLVRNLADNAVRYSPPGARVRVQLSACPDGGVRLCVEDSGPGMDEVQRSRIGERFFRVLGSGEEGSGLGWSIVQRVAAAHRAVLRVERSSALGGLRVEVDWPPAGGASAGVGSVGIDPDANRWRPHEPGQRRTAPR